MKHICFLTSAFGREDSLMVIRQGISLVHAGYKVSYLLCDGLPPETRYGIDMSKHEKSGLYEIIKYCFFHRKDILIRI